MGGVSRKHPEFPKKPNDFPQQKYNGLFQKYCRIKGIKGRYEPDKIDEKRVAKRDKRLNAIRTSIYYLIAFSIVQS